MSVEIWLAWFMFHDDVGVAHWSSAGPKMLLLTETVVPLSTIIVCCQE